MEALSFPLRKAHLAEEVLEEYVFDRLPEAHAAEVEEHLLVCAQCRESLEGVDEFILLAKMAAVEYQRRPAPRIWSFLNGMWGRAALAGSLGAVFLAALNWWKPSGPEGHAIETNPVALRAMRGGDLAGVAHAPAGWRLTMEIDLTGLPLTGPYRVQMVDAIGGTVWEISCNPSQGYLRPRVDKRLKPGVYWVRLYSQAAGLLREFGMQVD